MLTVIVIYSILFVHNSYAQSNLTIDDEGTLVLTQIVSVFECNFDGHHFK